jgi:hypothetical protein
VRIATGYISHVVCSYVFVSGLDPARVSMVDVAGNPVFNGFHWALRHTVDRERREVTAQTVLGFESRAVYREGLGCLNLNGGRRPDGPRSTRRAGGRAPARHRRPHRGHAVGSGH